MTFAGRIETAGIVTPHATTHEVPRPTPLPVCVEGIPDSLRVERRWVIWKYEWREPKDGKPGRWTKVPYIATAIEQKADSTDPSTWRSFDDALSAYEDRKCDGIGFTLGDGWTGFDSDHNDSPEYVRLLNTYAERSPSGDGGIHAVCRGTKPGPRCKIGDLELYDHGKYFTVTGHHVAGTPTTVEERTTELAILYARLFPNGHHDQTNGAPTPPPDDTTTSNTLTDDAVIAKASASKSGAKFVKLWAGDITGYPSHSEADAALCSMLAFWTNRDPITMDRLFRRSGLKRDKWDEPRGGSTYGADVIAKSIALTTEGYGATPTNAIYADRVDPKTVDLVWERFVISNEPPTLFRRQRKIVMPVAEEITSNFDHLFARQLKIQIAQTCREQNGASFAEVDIDLFTELLARSIPFVKDVGRGDSKTTVPAYPSPRLVRQIMASPVIPLPLARGMIRTPSYDSAGTLLREPGYHAESGIFYAHPPGFVLPEIPDKPSAFAVENAIIHWNSMVGEFPFVDGTEGAAHAHTLALALTVLARELIAGPVPMCLVSKPTTGTGGTLLIQCIGWTVLGEPLPESSWSDDQEELRKYLTTLLMRGRALVNLDNITYLHSKDLLSVLSGEVREDRRLGGNELLTIPNRATFVGSGNNVTYNEEHAGRLYVVRLDAGVENPRLRDQTFTHPNLYEWTKANRPTLVAALLTLVQAWIAEGQPAYKGKRLAGFEAWSNVIGGILANAKVKGFLENRDQVMRNAQRSQEEDIEFVAAWYACQQGDKPTLVDNVKTREILIASGMNTVLPKAKNGSDITSITLGLYLERNVDRVRVLDGGTTVAIRRAAEDAHAKTQRWWLEVLDAKPEAARKVDDDTPF